MIFPYFLSCTVCRRAFRFQGDPKEGLLKEILLDGLKCPVCEDLGNASLALEPEVSEETKAGFDVMELTIEEMFRAQMGLGTPDQIGHSKEQIMALLQEKPITSLRLTEGIDRCVLEYIGLSDGTRLHIGGSSHGAIIYKVTKPISYTQKALANG